MTNWPAFAGITGVVLAVLLVLARVSQAALDDASLGGGDAATDAPDPDRPAANRFTDPPPEAADDADARAGPEGPDGSPARPAYGGSTDESLPDPFPGPDGPEGTAGAADRDDEDGVPDVTPAAVRSRKDGAGAAGELSTAALLANVAVSQGLLGTLLLAGAWYAAVPLAALGAGRAGIGPGPALAGVGLGAALYVANEAGAAVGRRVGLGGGEELRAALAPETAVEWAALLLVVLPVIAGFEELLFRGALVGAMSAGFGVSPWLLAVGSSVAFAAGHGAQGRVGMAVTGTLGFVLAAAFVVTGSLLVVVVAHYLVNALEFLVHEWAGVDPAEWEWTPDRERGPGD